MLKDDIGFSSPDQPGRACWARSPRITSCRTQPQNQHIMRRVDTALRGSPNVRVEGQRLSAGVAIYSQPLYVLFSLVFIFHLILSRGEQIPRGEAVAPLIKIR